VQENNHVFSRIQPGSERSFGLVFSTVFGILCALAAYKKAPFWPHWLALSALFAMCALFCPAALKTLNILWFKFALLLGKYFEPITMAVFYMLIFTPIALCRRALGTQPLALKYDPTLASYWIVRKDDAGIQAPYANAAEHKHDAFSAQG
jgi:hypothetical protein